MIKNFSESEAISDVTGELIAKDYWFSMPVGSLGINILYCWLLWNV